VTTSGASLRAREKRRRFFPKSNKDFARNTSCTVLRRIGTVPLGHSVPFLCHSCIPISLFSFTFIPFGISHATLCCIHIHSNISNKKTNLFPFNVNESKWVPGSCDSSKGGDLKPVAFFCGHNLWDHHQDSGTIHSMKHCNDYYAAKKKKKNHFLASASQPITCICI